MIRDQASASYATPWFSVSLGTALREFEQGITHPDTVYFQYPEHFSMYHLGTFDEVDGKFELFTEPQFVAKAVEFVERARVEQQPAPVMPVREEQ